MSSSNNNNSANNDITQGLDIEADGDTSTTTPTQQYLAPTRNLE